MTLYTINNRPKLLDLGDQVEFEVQGKYGEEDYAALTRLVNALFDFIAAQRLCGDCPLKEKKEEPKPVRFKVGDWVRSLRGANHDGQIGEIVFDDGTPEIPYKVKFLDGDIEWQAIKNIEHYQAVTGVPV